MPPLSARAVSFLHRGTAVTTMPATRHHVLLLQAAGRSGIAGGAAPANGSDLTAERSLVSPSGPDQMGSRAACFGRVQEAMCFSKALRILSSRGSTSAACPTRVTEATLSPAGLRSTLARASCDP
jgi:hypothetical protein